MSSFYIKSLNGRETSQIERKISAIVYKYYWHDDSGFRLLENLSLMDYGLIYIIMAFSVGLWMTWGVGANDLANIMSTAMGSKAITVKQAMIIAIVFEVAGAFLGGNE